MSITFYTTHCAKCKILKQKLDEKGIEYDICDDVNIMLSEGIRSAPVLEVDGEIMNYLNAVNWLKEI